VDLSNALLHICGSIITSGRDRRRHDARSSSRALADQRCRRAIAVPSRGSRIRTPARGPAA